MAADVRGRPEAPQAAVEEDELEFETMPVIDLEVYLQGVANAAAAAGSDESS